MAVDPREEVLTDEFLLGEIMSRIGSSKSYIRSGCVNKFWYETAKNIAVLDLFRRSTAQSFFAFLVEFQTFIVREIRLLHPTRAPGDETMLALESGLDEATLRSVQVVATDGAMVLYAVERPGGPVQTLGYHARCSFSRTAPLRYVGSLMPKIPQAEVQRTANTFGQYGVLIRAGNKAFSPISFFAKEVSSPFMCSYSGVRFNSDSPVYVHVSVYEEKIWTRFVSGPLAPPPLATFQRNPYSVLVGSKLYMMYLVGFIVRFDLDGRTFTVIELPGDMPTTASSWFDYTVARGDSCALSLVHFLDGNINRWCMHDEPDGVHWELDSTFDLVPAFAVIVQNFFPDAQLIDLAIDWGSIQMRSASQGCRYVFMSAGVNAGLFIADMLEKNVTDIPNLVQEGSLGRIFQLQENWPPRM